MIPCLLPMSPSSVFLMSSRSLFPSFLPSDILYCLLICLHIPTLFSSPLFCICVVTVLPLLLTSLCLLTLLKFLLVRFPFSSPLHRVSFLFVVPSCPSSSPFNKSFVCPFMFDLSIFFLPLYLLELISFLPSYLLIPPFLCPICESLSL